MLLLTQLLYNLPFIIRDTSLLVSSGITLLYFALRLVSRKSANKRICLSIYRVVGAGVHDGGAAGHAPVVDESALGALAVRRRLLRRTQRDARLEHVPLVGRGVAGARRLPAAPAPVRAPAAARPVRRGRRAARHVPRLRAALPRPRIRPPARQPRLPVAASAGRGRLLRAGDDVAVHAAPAVDRRRGHPARHRDAVGARRTARHPTSYARRPVLAIETLYIAVAPPGGGEGEASPIWVDVQKLCNMCVLSLSWNFFVSHDKYIARPSSKEPR